MPNWTVLKTEKSRRVWRDCNIGHQCHGIASVEDEEFELGATSSLLRMPFKYNNNNSVCNAIRLGRDPLFSSAGPGGKQNTGIFVHAQM